MVSVGRMNMKIISYIISTRRLKTYDYTIATLTLVLSSMFITMKCTSIPVITELAQVCRLRYYQQVGHLAHVTQHIF